jgi:Xaa-Pro aminopeptidase
MHEEQRQRAHDHLTSRGIARALFASPASVTWLTGFAPPVQLGPSPFAGGPPLVWYAGGEWALIVLDSHSEAAAASGIPVVTYLGYTIDAPIAGHDHLVAALRSVAGRFSGQVGVEERALPAYLRAELPTDARPAPIDGALAPLRAIKTAEELEKLRASVALTDIGHAAARAAVQPGQREIDIWTAIHGAVQQAAGRRVPLGNDCVVGYRQANIGGWPLDLTIRPGDSVVVDLSTILDGYWSDSCGTYYAGAPDERQVAMHHTAAAALEFAISLVRPGAVSGEIDARVRQFIADAGYPVYPHHTGHGVGVTGHEEPRIVPYNTMPLAPGMVILLEPGIYFPGVTSVRLEDAVLVTDDGTEVLSKHDKSLPSE